ncbi:hypothetical protein LX77_00890 [Gelidibacter algens]|uniref:Outer membrane protein n=1 Tax=Gelidibacter algens TaxID=49280 RepID=A0A1A7R3W2_9FLAO|nr:hypothetical protein [Gelidibacter algens]OBX26536.1 hypothetical protein A9996_04380 [Gelidibacter algens]RAJ26635.1 hypothetical protein LX77_00890 [Gelidibacter algens]
MKKILLIAVAFVGGTMMMNAQDIADNAIGLRIGGNSDGSGAEVSYQRALGDSNRLELDLGFINSNKKNDEYDGFKLAGIYQWVWNIDGGFNWYAGPGAGIASKNYNKYRGLDIDETQTFVFIGGDVGIEYNFDFPLLLSLDFRPEFGLGNDEFNNNELDFALALGVRYQF